MSVGAPQTHRSPVVNIDNGASAWKDGVTPNDRPGPMNSNIAPLRTLGPIPGRTCLRAKMYPNGECAVWKQKTYKPRAVKREVVPRFTPSILTLWAECGSPLSWVDDEAAALGLSPLPNFDSSLSEGSVADEGVPGVVKLYGSRGITSHGRRMVRNAAYLIEHEGGRSRAVFATVTVPSLPMEQMRVLHERWHKATEIYRLGLKRALRKQGLSGESVSVSEIQEKRYQRTGVPVLHIHTVFIGKTASGQWAITPEDHDRIWLAALNVAIGVELNDISVACNLQRVKKSTEGYIGKYMTKGSKVVGELVRKGFAGWIPQQWWSCSRSLRARIDRKTRCVHDLANWLNDAADFEGTDVWLWHKDVVLEMMDGYKVTIARYGRLSIRQTAEIHAYYEN